MSGLRFKIFLAMGVLVVTTVGVLGLLSRGVTRSGVHQIVELEEVHGWQMDLALAEAVRQDLEEAWGRDGDFRAAETLLAAFDEATGGGAGVALFDSRPELVAGVGMPSDRVEARLLGELEAGVVEGTIEARWTVEDEGDMETLVLRGGLPVRGADGRRVGTLLPIPRSSPERQADRRAALVRVDRRLLAAAAGVGAVALLLGGLLARRIVRPVEALADAARDLGAGNLGRRVHVTSNDELGRLGSAFNDMAAALERAEALRRQMVADVAHELRTPLAALRAQLEAVQDGLAEATPETVASLVEDAVHLGGLVDDLQDLALVDAGRLSVDRRSVDLEREVRAAAGSLGLEPGPCLEIDLPGEAPFPPVDADPRRLRQILHNLLENARVHGRSGTPERPIRISLRAVAGPSAVVEVTVRDHGPGVSAGELPRMFGRFHRGDPSRARDSGGSGLGLAVAKAFVELHGGDVRAENAPGGGVAVTFVIPLTSTQGSPATVPANGESR